MGGGVREAREPRGGPRGLQKRGPHRQRREEDEEREDQAEERRYLASKTVAGTAPSMPRRPERAHGPRRSSGGARRGAPRAEVAPGIAAVSPPVSARSLYPSVLPPRCSLVGARGIRCTLHESTAQVWTLDPVSTFYLSLCWSPAPSSPRSSTPVRPVPPLPLLPCLTCLLRQLSRSGARGPEFMQIKATASRGL